MHGAHPFVPYTRLFNRMRHDTPFCMFSKDNMAHVTQAKKGHGGEFGVFVWQR